MGCCYLSEWCLLTSRVAGKPCSGTTEKAALPGGVKALTQHFQHLELHFLSLMMEVLFCEVSCAERVMLFESCDKSVLLACLQSNF